MRNGGFTDGSRCINGADNHLRFTNSRSAAVPPQAVEVGACAPAPAMCASMAPHRAIARTRPEIDEAVAVETTVASMVHLLHHGRVDIDCRPRLRQRGGGCSWRGRQHAEGNQAGCQSEFSDHGSIPHCHVAASGARAPFDLSPHTTLCTGHLNDDPTSSSGAVHFKSFG